MVVCHGGMMCSSTSICDKGDVEDVSRESFGLEDNYRKGWEVC